MAFWLVNILHKINFSKNLWIVKQTALPATVRNAAGQV